MDKLKKRILFALLMLLAASLAGLAALISCLHPKQDNPGPNQNPPETVRADFAAHSLPPAVPDQMPDALSKPEPPATPSQTEQLPVFPAKEHNSDGQKLEEIVLQIKDENIRLLIQKAKLDTPLSGPMAWGLAEAYLKIQQDHPQQLAPVLWKKISCSSLPLPSKPASNITCKTGEQAFCSFFENGQPSFCQTKDGLTEYISNQQGTSLLMLQKTSQKQPLYQYYYANGELERFKKFDEKNNLVTIVWFEGNALRLMQTDIPGKILGKYYFYPGKPYVYYPDGNDMGEINGEWEEKNGQIFMDGKLFFRLPLKIPQPNLCALFGGACAPARTQAKQELL